MTGELVHPRWCAVNYRCTVTRAAGEHLSQPLTLPTRGYVSTVVCLAQRPGERAPIAEIRLRVRLTAPDERRQARQIQHLVLHLVEAAREVAQ